MFWNDDLGITSDTRHGMGSCWRCFGFWCRWGDKVCGILRTGCNDCTIVPCSFCISLDEHSVPWLELWHRHSPMCLVIVHHLNPGLLVWYWKLYSQVPGKVLHFSVLELWPIVWDNDVWDPMCGECLSKLVGWLPASVNSRQQQPNSLCLSRCRGLFPASAIVFPAESWMEWLIDLWRSVFCCILFNCQSVPSDLCTVLATILPSVHFHGTCWDCSEIHAPSGWCTLVDSQESQSNHCTPYNNWSLTDCHGLAGMSAGFQTPHVAIHSGHSQSPGSALCTITTLSIKMLICDWPIWLNWTHVLHHSFTYSFVCIGPLESASVINMCLSGTCIT